MIKTKENGITLIALIITIIVMLILVGVTVNVALNGGLFDTAKRVASKTEIEACKEQLFQTALGTVTENGYVDFSKLDNNLPDEFDGSSGTYKRNNITYRVNCYGEVTSIDFDSILSDVLNNPETYLGRAEDLGQDIESDKNIGIGTDGSIVNLALWTYEIVDNEISISTYDGDKNVESIIIPQYIYVDELKKNAPVTSITKLSALKNLEEITIPDTLTNISNGCFLNCSSLEAIIIPYGVQKIPNACFANCISLETIIIPDSVTTIGVNVFNGCRALKSIKIPKSVTKMSTSFTSCTSLTLIEIDNTENAIEGSPWGAHKATIKWLRDS